MDNDIVVAGKSQTMLYFLQDVKPQSSIYKFQYGVMKEINLDEIGEFDYDNRLSVGMRNIESHKVRMAELAVDKTSEVYLHAKNYVEFKEKNLHLPEISSIEFTNNCNLKCPNCPNSTLTFHKGYMSKDTFYKTLEYLPPYKNDTIAVHCMGEPLLHPDCFLYLEELAKLKVNICMSTNGLLLDEETGHKIMQIFSNLDKTVLYVSFHTKKSVENWYNFLKIYQMYPNKTINFYGQILEHNEDEALQWLKEIGINNPNEHEHIRMITSHSWGGNVASRRKDYSSIEIANRIRVCHYLRNRKVAVMWDGSLRGCCFDSNATQKCGNIFEFEKADIDPHGYELCKHCEPDWITGYQ